MADGSQQESMKIITERAQQLVENISSVAARVKATAGERPVRYAFAITPLSLRHRIAI